jgi:hypothetical protein
MQRETGLVLGSLLVGIGTMVAILIVQKEAGLPLLDAATTVASIIGAVAAYLVFQTLKAAYETLHADHEWKRRQYTAELMSHWNERARPDIEFLEHHFASYYPVPDFSRDLSKDTGEFKWHMDADYAKTIVNSVKNLAHEKAKPIDSEIRDRLVRLFNYFEDVSVAYELGVIEREPIAESFGSVMIEIYLYYEPFVVEMGKLLYRQPWPPFSRIVELWIRQARLQTAARDRDIAQQKWEETKKNAKLMPPTDQLPSSKH